MKKLVKEFRLGDTGRIIEKVRLCCITYYSINWFAGSWRHEQAAYTHVRSYRENLATLQARHTHVRNNR